MHPSSARQLVSSVSSALFRNRRTIMNYQGKVVPSPGVLPRRNPVSGVINALECAFINGGLITHEKVRVTPHRQVLEGYTQSSARKPHQANRRSAPSGGQKYQSSAPLVGCHGAHAPSTSRPPLPRLAPTDIRSHVGTRAMPVSHASPGLSTVHRKPRTNPSRTTQR